MASWIVPCNEGLYRVFDAFSKLEAIDWKQSASSIVEGDSVYLYVSQPHSRIAFKCLVEKTGFNGVEIADDEFVVNDEGFHGSIPHMRLRRVRAFSEGVLGIDSLRAHGLKGNVQGQARLNDEVLSYIETVERGLSLNAYTENEIVFAKDAVVSLLTSLGDGNGRLFYSDITAQYEERTGVHRANEYPAGPLGYIQEVCHLLGLPCLSVMAVSKKTKQPSMDGFIPAYRVIYPENAAMSDKEIVAMEQKACQACPASEWQRLVDYLGIENFVAPEPRNVRAEWDAHILAEEGEKVRLVVDREVSKRDPKLRDACLVKKGSACIICGFDSSLLYGIPGIIHVHHLRPVCEGVRKTDVDRDLVPLCPTCHALVHSKPGRNNVFKINEVRAMMGKEPLPEYDDGSETE